MKNLVFLFAMSMFTPNAHAQMTDGDVLLGSALTLHYIQQMQQESSSETTESKYVWEPSGNVFLDNAHYLAGSQHGLALTSLVLPFTNLNTSDEKSVCNYVKRAADLIKETLSSTTLQERDVLFRNHITDLNQIRVELLSICNNKRLLSQSNPGWKASAIALVTPGNGDSKRIEWAADTSAELVERAYDIHMEIFNITLQLK